MILDRDENAHPWHHVLVSAAESPFDVAIANDYGVVVAGLATLLAPFDDRMRVVELDMNARLSHPVDVVLYDTFARTEPGLVDLRRLIANPNAKRVVVFTWTFDTEMVDRAFTSGAVGYLSKTASAEEIASCLARVVEGEQVVVPPQGRALVNRDLDWPGKAIDLSAREAEVMALITQGRSNREIAELLHLSVNTIKGVIRTAYRKVGVKNRIEAVLWGTGNGMQPDHGRRRLDN